MRLIDADALKQECMHIDDIPAVTERDIDNAPTIDAIPVKWLNNKITNGNADIHRCAARVLFEWQKEQEAR